MPRHLSSQQPPCLLDFLQLDFLQSSSKPALRYSNGKPPITYEELRNFTRDFGITVSNNRFLTKPIIAIILPNGPLLAATIVAVSNLYISAPINPGAGPDQVKADIALSRASAIISCPSEVSALQLDQNGLDIFLVDEAGKPGNRLEVVQTTPVASTREITPNGPEDIAMILFTSGTSGNRKVVPITVGTILYGVKLVVDSWGLTDRDICLNMMPLYHIGGIIRNLFAPLFSGGSTICCPNFDPNLFWDQIEDVQPTWYYASPTMHSMVLEESRNRPHALRQLQIRLVCNAAGGLLPALAERIRDTFGCTVLPSYGMTECMPISSPTLSYSLDRPGTSGIVTGPELSIMNGNSKQVAPFETGRICLRGGPVFQGYLKADGSLDKSAFDAQGWFDTGDTGYLDRDGYIYITGRNKEVINRGGEIISPFEVEDAIVTAAARQDSPTCGRISQALAFSVRHDTLQEAVGIVLVTPPGRPKVDLRSLHKSLRSSLQQAKWPVVIVYMDDVPKRNNKVLRVKLAERLDMPCIDDYTPFSQRHFSARCPPTETELSVPIPSTHCLITPHIAYDQIRQVFMPLGFEIYIDAQPDTGVLAAYLAPKPDGGYEPDEEDADALTKLLFKRVDGYLVPHSITAIQKPFPQNAQGGLDKVLFAKMVKEAQLSETSTLADTTPQKLTRLFADLLQLRTKEIQPQKDFFELGGDSLKAGKLLSAIRTEFGVRVAIDFIFKHGTIQQLSEYIEEEQNDKEGHSHREESQPLLETQRTHSSTNPYVLVLQLIPLMVVYPLRRAFSWTLFIYSLMFFLGFDTSKTLIGRLVNVVVSTAFARMASSLVIPWFGIAAKWLIIGRYKEGLYPMWGPYHTRWWMTQKIVMICGKGAFGSTDTTKIWYHRLMGAKIGSGVTMKNVRLGEWDLLDIGDNATLDECTIRPMAGERNTMMYLAKITIGSNASVGVGSTIAPGATVPDSACVGARSSSWELQDASEENRDLSATKAPKPHWALSLFLTLPLRFIVIFLYNLPWLLGLLGLVQSEAQPMRSMLIRVIHWFTQGERVGWYYFARSLRTFFGPVFAFMFVVIIRKLLAFRFGPLKPSATSERGNVDTWRMTLIKTLWPNSSLSELTDLFGSHYEATSVAIRLLGGKVGRYVYWPGTGPSFGDYELVNVGNHVVFGSRSHLINVDATGSDFITIQDGAMIADRVVAYPGVVVEREATLGSGCLTKRGKTYESNGIYVGSRGGDTVFLGVRQREEKEDVTDYEDFKRLRKRIYPGESRLQRLRRVLPAAFRPKFPFVSKKSTEDLFDNKGFPSDRPGHIAVTSIPDSETSDDTISPFGKAFYQRKTTYFVWRQWMIFLYSSLSVLFTHAYWTAASISAIQVVGAVFVNTPWLGTGSRSDPFILFSLCAALLSALMAVQSLIALGIVIAAKWILLGRRQPGNYDWDKSSYCQRWQLFMAIERIRRNCFAGHGILGLLTGTAYMTWYFRALGAKIGKDCALFVSGRPSLLFTEPDLLEMGDRVVVDDASLVGHINTRGKFDLNRLYVGDRCVLRTNSRLLSGARMEKDSCLLENTLIMGGDIVDQGETMQGWPASRFRGERIAN
ncbi:acetyl-CoA synthetase-like protein [Xylaria arbuscula]|nr:acetyl-CoA synthetase-like protein [Xylaria arbuscula]